MFITTRNLSVIAALLGALLSPSTAAAEAPLAALHAAQACFVEAGWSETDCAAIIGVLQRRAKSAGQSFEATLWSYSALKAASPRARLGKGLPAGDLELWDAANNAAWKSLRELAARVLSGAERAPCPRAKHYGARNLAGDVDNAEKAVREGKWKIARCSSRTLNIFYELTSRADRASTAAQLLLLQAHAPRAQRVPSGPVDARAASGSYRRADHRVVATADRPVSDRGRALALP